VRVALAVAGGDAVAAAESTGFFVSRAVQAARRHALAVCTSREDVRISWLSRTVSVPATSVRGDRPLDKERGTLAGRKRFMGFFKGSESLKVHGVRVLELSRTLTP
jgi:hypothetical protein